MTYDEMVLGRATEIRQTQVTSVGVTTTPLLRADASRVAIVFATRATGYSGFTDCVDFGPPDGTTVLPVVVTGLANLWGTVSLSTVGQLIMGPWSSFVPTNLTMSITVTEVLLIRPPGAK